MDHGARLATLASVVNAAALGFNLESFRKSQRGIPKGFRLKAQGCEERATLGNRAKNQQPQRGCGHFASRCTTFRHCLNPLRGCELADVFPRVARSSQPLYVVFHLPCLASAKQEDGAALPRPGERSGAGVIVQPSDLLSPKPSLIHPRFCVPNSNRCQSGVSNTPARIRKNESEHIRNYE